MSIVLQENWSLNSLYESSLFWGCSLSLWIYILAYILFIFIFFFIPFLLRHVLQWLLCLTWSKSQFKKNKWFFTTHQYWSKIRWKTGIFWLTRKPKWKEHKTHANRNIKNTCLDCTNTTFDLKRKFSSTELQYIGQWYQITQMSSSPL